MRPDGFRDKLIGVGVGTMATDTQGENKSEYLPVMVTPDQLSWVKARAAAEGRSAGSVIRRLIDSARVWQDVAKVPR